MGTETEATPANSGLTPLCELAQKYGTDKLGLYTPIYDLLLSGRRDSVSRVLEVGIGTPQTMQHIKDYKPGASLRMWRDYFPNATVYGIDINGDACDANDAMGRIVTFCTDGRDPGDTLSSLRFDLIVDDGNHQPEVQIETFRKLSPLLTTGGLYIIEDAEFFSELTAHLPEHTLIRHHTKQGLGLAILIRQEAISG